jgi:hypothetical protein
MFFQIFLTFINEISFYSLLIIVCSCTDEDCPMVYAPVCGADGITCGNDCLARNTGINENVTECSNYKN